MTGRLVEEADDSDVAIVGTTRRSRLRQTVVGAVPEEVGRRAGNIAITVERNAGSAPGIAGRVREFGGDD